MKTSGFATLFLCFVLLVSVAELAQGDVAAATAPAGPRDGNLLFNGDLEKETTSSPPDGWTMWGAEQDKRPANYTRDQTNPHGGKACLRIHHPANNRSYLVSAPDRAIQPREGMLYTISFWARADNPGRLPFYLEVYRSIRPLIESSGTVGDGAIDVTTDWKQFTFECQEGWDFFARNSPYLVLVFHAAARQEEARTLWIDDLSVVEKKSTRAGRLADESELKYQPLQHRLRSGERLEFSVDARKILRPATKDAAGISFHRLTGWTGVPFDRKGQYVLAPELEQAIKNLRLPMTRFYGVGDEPFGTQAAIDKVADLCGRLGIPRDHTVLELETQGASRKLTPQQWAAAVQHSEDKGYGFRYWEVANEPYAAIRSAALAYPNAEDYARQVRAVSAAVRKVDPNSQVGIAVDVSSLMWCNYALRQAAGAYDFVVGHFYSVGDGSSGKEPFEQTVLGLNYRTLDHILRLNALIRHYNPGRQVYQLDTEWGMYASGPRGESPERNIRNSNVVGTLHRAVRLVYYTREDILRGASSWEMFRSLDQPGFGILSPEAPDKRFLLYWLYYYFNRHVGDSALEMDGTCPYYTPRDKAAAAVDGGPLTPALVTLSKDAKTMYLVAVNGSWDKSIPCRMTIANFPPKAARGVALSQEDMDSKPLLDKKQDAISDLAVTVAGQEIRCTLPPHSAVFLMVDSD